MTGIRTLRPVPRWRPGDQVASFTLNRTVDALNELRGLEPPRDKDAEESQVNDDTDDSIPGAAETWRFVSSETRTERIESSDDSEVYVDVEITRSVYVSRPDGVIIKLELEDQSNG